MNYANSSTAYRTNAILTASSPQLIVMLYDGARRFLTQASAAMAEHRIELAHRKLRRAEMILRHLQGTLDTEQGEVAVNLAAVYGFYLRQCSRARFSQDPKMIDEVNAMLGQLRESWATIAAREAQPEPAAALAS